MLIGISFVITPRCVFMREVSIARHYWYLHTTDVRAFLRTSRLSRTHFLICTDSPGYCALAEVIPWRSNSTDQVAVPLPVRMPSVGKPSTLQPATRLSGDVCILGGFSTHTWATLCSQVGPVFITKKRESRTAVEMATRTGRNDCDTPVYWTHVACTSCLLRSEYPPVHVMF
jgi:hypothetical protein